MSGDAASDEFKCRLLSTSEMHVTTIMSVTRAACGPDAATFQ
jgi:hypothetical protein